MRGKAQEDVMTAYEEDELWLRRKKEGFGKRS